MRELKFRVWDIDHKLYLPENVYDLHNRTSFNSFGIIRKDWRNYSVGEYFYDNAQILEQFTGLTDKNGKEIYTGDILDYWGGKDPVVFKDGAFQIKSTEFDFFDIPVDADIEVIGNIHQSKELINN